MNNRKLFILIGSFFLLTTSLVYANEDVYDWLQKMQRAAHMANYDGTFVYTQDDQLSAMRLIHKVDENGEHERLISLDSTGREVIRNNKHVTCVLPDSKAVVVEKGRPQVQFPPPFPASVEDLKKYYRFELGNRERVAGQLTQQIVITPRDQFRYGHRLWIDVKTGLLLQKHLMNETGKPVEKFMFTRIEYMDVIPDEWLKSQSMGKEFTWYEADGNRLENKEKVQQWEVGWLPDGFVADMHREHQLPSEQMPLEHLVFSDGLSSISVFIEPQNKSGANLIGGSSMGAVNAHGRHVNGYHVTVVGEVPQAAVRQVCSSVKKKR